MTIIIAEIGSNPAPAWDFLTWCDVSESVGADAIKCQLFRADHFPESERAAKRLLEFPRSRMWEFVGAAHARGLTAGASVFDKEAVELAVRECDWLKLAAREQFNQELAWSCTDFPQTKPVYRSISYWDAWYRLAYPLHGGATLYAIQKYPAGMIESVIGTWIASRNFTRYIPRTRWGWSSHTRGWLDCWLAARLGASVIEKHLCLSPDDVEAGHSLLPHEFARMVRAIR